MTVNPRESWIDRQIREARERGAFDNLPGEGKPLQGLNGRHDPDWWVKRKIAAEGLEDVLPTAKSLRQEAKQLSSTLDHERNESDVREIVIDLNNRIRQAKLRKVDGPVVAVLQTFDVEAVVAEWRKRRR